MQIVLNLRRLNGSSSPGLEKKLNSCTLGLSKHNKEALSGAPEFKCPQGGLWVIVYPWNMVCLMPCLIICASMPRWKGGSVCFYSVQKSRFFVRGQGSFLCWSWWYWWKSLSHPDLRLVLRLPSQWLLFGFIWRSWSRISVGEISFLRPWRQMWHSGLTKSKHTQDMCWTRMRNETTQEFKKLRHYAFFCMYHIQLFYCTGGVYFDMFK